MESMTGFGLAEEKRENYSIKIQLKSVNHKYLDLKIKGLSEYFTIETKLRDFLQRKFNRGHIEVFIEIEKKQETKFSLNETLFDHYCQLLHLAQKKFEDSKPIDIVWVLNQEGVIEKEKIDLEEEITERLFFVAEEACSSLKEMRQAEGKSLYTKLEEDLDSLSKLTKRVEKSTRLSNKEMAHKMRTKIKEIQKEYELDESRFATELALMLDKITIEEEIVRLSSHIEQFNVIMDYKDPVGKKLDFLLQEMNREANTMGSKSRNIEVLHEIVEMKSIIENLREQVQNIE